MNPLTPADAGAQCFGRGRDHAGWRGARCSCWVPASAGMSGFRCLRRPVLHQIIHDRRIGQRRGVAQGAQIVLGDLPQDPPHDLARAGLGQTRRPLNHVGRGDGADLLADLGDQDLAQVFGGLDPLVQGDIGVDALTLDVVGEADDGGLGHVVVQDQGALDLGRAHAVARDVDHVINAARDPVIAVFVTAAAVTGEVHARIGLEIGVEEALVVAVDRAHLARPAVGDAQIALGRAVQHAAFGVDDLQLDAGQGLGRRAGLGVGGPGQRRDQMAAGLGLPEGVDDRAAALADVF
uniref:PE-PGRS family protein n=1 Tax=Parastrongyloides trichosuri TaxID=131310 RepID=A0A0N4Z5G8_PARTI